MHIRYGTWTHTTHTHTECGNTSTYVVPETVYSLLQVLALQVGLSSSHAAAVRRATFATARRGVALFFIIIFIIINGPGQWGTNVPVRLLADAGLAILRVQGYPADFAKVGLALFASVNCQVLASRNSRCTPVFDILLCIIIIVVSTLVG